MGILKFAFKTYLHFWRSSDTPLWIIFRRFIHRLKFTLGKSPKRPKQQDFSCRWAYPLNGKWNNGLSVKNISSQLSELWVMNTCWKESSKRVFLVTVILMCWGIDSCWRKRENVRSTWGAHVVSARQHLPESWVIWNSTHIHILHRVKCSHLNASWWWFYVAVNGLHWFRQICLLRS